MIEKNRQITQIRNDFVFGMESTAHYWLPLYTRLKKDGYTALVINPLQSDALRNMYSRYTLKIEQDLRGEFASDKAEDAAFLTQSKDDNTVRRKLYRKDVCFLKCFDYDDITQRRCSHAQGKTFCNNRRR
jgi:hypothetical protein